MAETAKGRRRPAAGLRCGRARGRWSRRGGSSAGWSSRRGRLRSDWVFAAWRSGRGRSRAGGPGSARILVTPGSRVVSSGPQSPPRAHPWPGASAPAPVPVLQRQGLARHHVGLAAARVRGLQPAPAACRRASRIRLRLRGRGRRRLRSARACRRSPAESEFRLDVLAADLDRRRGRPWSAPSGSSAIAAVLEEVNVGSDRGDRHHTDDRQRLAAEAHVAQQLRREQQREDRRRRTCSGRCSARGQGSC